MLAGFPDKFKGKARNDNDDEAEDNNPLKAVKKFVLDQRREEKGPGKDSACLGLAGVFSGATYKELRHRRCRGGCWFEE